MDLQRALFFGLGTLFLALATVGAFLPLLPTTPFLLLAASCYARGSERAHQWLLANRFFGPTIREWERSRTLSVRAKVAAIGLMWLAIGATALLAMPGLTARIVLLVIALGVTVLLVRIPSNRRT